MQCSSCHEQHGGFTLRQLRTRHNEAVCTKCHEHLHGPFIFGHPPGAADSCQTCHNPRGQHKHQDAKPSRTPLPLP